ncbi:hypothetical protein HK105_208807 [Polyrhizophydium stewartii]|uniref:F-box domain-containing protein n=1 Tax=Polyrhizophydium stewartii TaxID=2732419 RepID=A0ABR4MWT1_9FUNG
MAARYSHLPGAARAGSQSAASDASAGGLVEISLASSADSLPAAGHPLLPPALGLPLHPPPPAPAPAPLASGPAPATYAAVPRAVSPPRLRDRRRSPGPPVRIDEALIPLIVRFLDDDADLRACMRLSWLWFKAAARCLYAELRFEQLSGRRLALALRTLQGSAVLAATAAAAQATAAPPSALDQAATEALGASPTHRSPGAAPAPRSAPAMAEYHTLVRSVAISQIVFEPPSATPLQSWYLVRDLLGLCAGSLRSVSLAIGDDSFMDLPPDYIYLHSQLVFPRLRRLLVASRCMRLPEKLILELLRASPVGGLESIRLPRCLPNLGAPGWFLLAERGGPALRELVLTPAIGPNMLGWDEQLFVAGLDQLARAAAGLRRLDLSGHSLGISDKTLFLMLAHMRDMRAIHLPCGLADPHLTALLINEPWPHLETLDLTCHCVDGEARELLPNGMSCNRFVDTVILAVLEHLLNGVASSSFAVHLPVYLIAVKTSKRVRTIDWLVTTGDCQRISDEEAVFKSRIRVLAPTNRVAVSM